MSDYDKRDEWNLDRDLPRRDRQQPSYDRGMQRGTRGYDASLDPRLAAARKKRRKKRNRIKKVILTIFLTILLVGLIGVAGYIMMQHLPSGQSENEVYSREIDITDAICADIAVWLSTVDGSDITASWVRERCQTESDGIVVVSELNLVKKSKGNNEYTEGITQKSYDSMVTEVDIVLERLLTEIIADNLVKSGYAETVSADEAGLIATQVLGMGISDYIKENGVNLVPTIDQLNANYTYGDGNVRISKGTASFNPSGGNPFSEKIIEKKDSLVFIDSGKIYTKKGEN